MATEKGREAAASDQEQQVPIDKRYGAEEKLFGPAAERISKEEYDAVVNEIIAKAGSGFKKLASPDQLTDKESFGDIDLIALTDEEVNEDFLRRVFGDNLLEYHRGHVKTGDNYIYNTLIRLDSGKQVQVDFLRADDGDDFERKYIFYSKGHLSSFIGVVAKNLGFTYGTEGFFKKYRDSKGQWHNILITGDLKKGLQVLGYDSAAYEGIRTLEEGATFLASSPYFDSRYFNLGNMVRRDREAMRKSLQQRYIKGKLPEDKRRAIEDKGKFLEKLDERLEEMLPQEYQAYGQEVERIEAEIAERIRQRQRRLKALE